MLACHESELPEPNDYRPYHHPAGVNLIVVRGEDDRVRSFFNVCPHRGNTILYSPSGNAKRMTCIFHAWSFDAQGNCVRSEEHTSELQSRQYLVCRLLLEKKKNNTSCSSATTGTSADGSPRAHKGPGYRSTIRRTSLGVRSRRTAPLARVSRTGSSAAPRF